MEKFIFFDLDETLLHTRFSSTDQELAFNPLVRNFDTGTRHNPIFYASYPRPGALKLLEKVRSFVPEDRIFVMTSSTPDYAEWVNKGHGFMFDPSHIYARDHLHGKIIPSKLVKSASEKSRAYLIDNLHRSELGEKLSLLQRRLGFLSDQLYTYRVSEYFGPADKATPPNPLFGALSEQEIDDIVAFVRGEGTQIESHGLHKVSYSPWG